MPLKPSLILKSMNILDKIVATKKREIALKRHLVPVSQLEKSALFQRETHSLSMALRWSETGIIAEYKRRSPSKSEINQHSPIGLVAPAYQTAGASGMSVLTDRQFFGGSLEDLLIARAATHIPLLRKDFMIDEYQFYEAKAFGADVVLLIAACLSPEKIRNFTQLAHALKLEVLLEVHNETELRDNLDCGADMIGVNNRNLKNFEVDVATSKSLFGLIPEDTVAVSESGISEVDTVMELRTHGFQGFLIGERFMKTEDPGAAAAQFIKKLRP